MAESEALRLHLERARDREGGSRTVGVPTIGGGSAQPGVMVAGVKDVK